MQLDAKPKSPFLRIPTQSSISHNGVDLHWLLMQIFYPTFYIPFYILIIVCHVIDFIYLFIFHFKFWLFYKKVNKYMINCA